MFVIVIDETWGGTPEYAKYKGFIEKGTTYTKDGLTIKPGNNGRTRC